MLGGHERVTNDPVDTTSTNNDDALAQAAIQDKAAFAELYRRHMARVYHFFLVRLGDTFVAQDLTAQTFLAALEHIAHYQGTGKFRAWLMGIARNKAADYLRGRHNIVPLEAAVDVADTTPSPEDIVLAHMQLEQVTQTLQALAPDRAEALALRIFGGLTIEEVSQVMGKSPAAVKMLVHRAVRDLHERLIRQSEASS
jgi:RNA polymerase sigma-70 factor (ECF subfamily)